MASHKRKDSVVKGSFIAAIILCVIALAAGFFVSELGDLYYKLEKVKRIEISTLKDITELGDTIYNNELVLAKDIVVTDSSFRIGTAEKPFAGIFDGNGHTVTFMYAEADENTSLFGCIESTGKVCNTNFEFGEVTVSGNTFGGIAKINYGTVTDCKISIENLKISGNRGIYSPAVLINKGSISNLVINCKFSNSSVQSTEKSIMFGSVCSYNYGTVKNCIVVLEFKNFACVNELDLYLGETEENISISAVCSVTVKQAETLNCAAVIKQGVYTPDKVNGVNVVRSLSELVNDLTIFHDMDFDNRVWEISGGTLNLIGGGI